MLVYCDACFVAGPEVTRDHAEVLPYPGQQAAFETWMADHSGHELRFLTTDAIPEPVVAEAKAIHGDVERCVDIIVNRQMAGAGHLDHPVVHEHRRQARTILRELLRSGLVIMADPDEQARGLENREEWYTG